MFQCIVQKRENLPAGEAIDFIDALAIVVTSAFEAIILVNFAQKSFCSVRTGTVKPVDLIVTSSAVVTRIVGAVVDVELTLRPLETGQTVASVVAALIVARGTISVKGIQL